MSSWMPLYHCLFNLEIFNYHDSPFSQLELGVRSSLMSVSLTVTPWKSRCLSLLQITVSGHIRWNTMSVHLEYAPIYWKLNNKAQQGRCCLQPATYDLVQLSASLNIRVLFQSQWERNCVLKGDLSQPARCWVCTGIPKWWLCRNFIFVFRITKDDLSTDSDWERAGTYGWTDTLEQKS